MRIIFSFCKITYSALHLICFCIQLGHFISSSIFWSLTTNILMQERDWQCVDELLINGWMKQYSSFLLFFLLWERLKVQTSWFQWLKAWNSFKELDSRQSIILLHGLAAFTFAISNSYHFPKTVQLNKNYSIANN